MDALRQQENTAAKCWSLQSYAPAGAGSDRRSMERDQLGNANADHTGGYPSVSPQSRGGPRSDATLRALLERMNVAVTVHLTLKPEMTDEEIINGDGDDEQLN
jgi:hypothetical protein